MAEIGWRQPKFASDVPQAYVIVVSLLDIGLCFLHVKVAGGSVAHTNLLPTPAGTGGNRGDRPRLSRSHPLRCLARRRQVLRLSDPSKHPEADRARLSLHQDIADAHLYQYPSTRQVSIGSAPVAPNVQLPKELMVDQQRRRAHSPPSVGSHSRPEKQSRAHEVDVRPVHRRAYGRSSIVLSNFRASSLREHALINVSICHSAIYLTSPPFSHTIGRCVRCEIFHASGLSNSSKCIIISIIQVRSFLHSGAKFSSHPQSLLPAFSGSSDISAPRFRRTRRSQPQTHFPCIQSWLAHVVPPRIDVGHLIPYESIQVYETESDSARGTCIALPNDWHSSSCEAFAERAVDKPTRLHYLVILQATAAGLRSCGMEERVS